MNNKKGLQPFLLEINYLTQEIKKVYRFRYSSYYCCSATII